MTSWTPDLNGRSGPLYRTIADALADDVASGRLAPQTRLPTHRELAYRLKVTVGTVTRAYAEAERRGLIGGEVGRGTFVRGQTREREERVDSGENLWLPAPTQLINLSKCIPPVPEVEQALTDALARVIAAGRLPDLLGYGTQTDTLRHQAAGADWLVRQHRAQATAETTLLTVGTQNGMMAALATVARPGDMVLTECLTYHGIKSATAALGLGLEGLPIDADGLLPESFDLACRRGTATVLYTVPTIHNPTGTVLPAERRKEIAAIARRHGVLILEDDVFGFLAPDAPPPIQTLAPDLTIYATSVSKSIAAGLRVGYLVAPSLLIPKLQSTLRGLQYSGPSLLAELASLWIGDGQADRFATLQRQEARARQTLARSVLPAGLAHGHPAAQHLWMDLPEPWRREDFVVAARDRGVAITSGSVFALGRGSVPHAVRIGLCMPRSREEVARGLRILTDILGNPASASFAIV